MKLITVILVLILVQVNAQVPDWVWARKAQSGINSNAGGEGFTVTSDTEENIFVGGWFIDTLIFDTVSFNYQAGVFLAKYDSIGNLKWAKCGISSIGCQGIAGSVVTDFTGHSYLAGGFCGSIIFDGDTLISAGASDIFIVKYDSDGNLDWAKRAGGIAGDGCSGVALDQANNIFMTGVFDAQFIFGSDTLNNTINSNIFLAKYDSLGNPLWAKCPIRNCFYVSVGNVVIDALGNLYIPGSFGPAPGSLTFGSTTITSSGDQDIFLVKYDSTGNVLWAKSAGGTGYDFGRYIISDVSCNLYLTGLYNSPSIIFNLDTLINPTAYHYGYLAKYDSSGNPLWAKNIKADHAVGYCLASDNNDKIYISGGSQQITDTILMFDTLITYYPTGSVDPMFVAACDTSGNVVFVKTLASGADDQNAITLGPSGSIYVAGDYYQVNPFVVGNDSLSLTGEENVFVAKLAYSIVNGISQTDKNRSCSFYPNPFSDKLNIYVNEKDQSEIILYDILSRKLLQQKFIGAVSLNTEQIGTGIYIYEVRTKDNCIKGKICKN